MNYKILKALIVKEFYQITRDPSSLLIAFILPFILLSIYMYGVNMDTVKVTMGLKVDDNNPEIASFAESFGQSKYVFSHYYDNKDDMYADLIRSKLHAFIIVPNDFLTKLDRDETADIIVVTDGSEINLSKYALSYTQSIANNWLASSPKYKYKIKEKLIEPESRFWYNQDIRSQNFILPGSLATTMTILGMLLTALVISREWERGTMEGLLATRVNKMEFIVSKYIPYFIVGMLSVLFSVFICIIMYDVPFAGSYAVLFLISALFLLTSLGFGLFISIHFKEQFLASQAALGIGFMPALFLSGLIFPIASMPFLIQIVTVIIPTRYYVSFIQSEFMTGSVPEIIIPNTLFLSTLGIILFIAVYKGMKMRLD